MVASSKRKIFCYKQHTLNSAPLSELTGNANFYCLHPGREVHPNQAQYHVAFFTAVTISLSFLTTRIYPCSTDYTLRREPIQLKIHFERKMLFLKFAPFYRCGLLHKPKKFYYAREMKQGRTHIYKYYSKTLWGLLVFFPPRAVRAHLKTSAQNYPDLHRRNNTAT